MDIKIVLTDAARQFIIALPPEIQKKFTLSFRKTMAGYKGDWFKKLQGDEDLFEFRVSGNNTWYRVLAFWSEKEKSIIIVTHGFEKKQNKTPKKEIDKASVIKNGYNKGGS